MAGWLSGEEDRECELEPAPLSPLLWPLATPGSGDAVGGRGRGVFGVAEGREVGEARDTDWVSIRECVRREAPSRLAAGR